MKNMPLWLVEYETTAVGRKHVAADDPAGAIAAVEAHERQYARGSALTVHIRRIERLGMVMLP